MTDTALMAVDEAPGTQVAAPRRSVGLLRPIAPVGEIIEAQEQTREFITKALKPGRDYGVIPGTDRGEGGGKKNLLKPGAERVCAGFGVRPEYELLSEEVEHNREVSWLKRKKKWGKGRGEFAGWDEERGVSYGLYRYVVRCVLVHIETGSIVGSGIGACSTMEGKYVDRPRESENTVLKMSKKRAFVDATLTTFGLSDAFTQDMEDAAIQAEEAEAIVLATPAELEELRVLAVRAKPGDEWFKKFAAAREKGFPKDKLQEWRAPLEKRLARADKEAARSAPPADEQEPEHEMSSAYTPGEIDDSELPF